MFNKRLAAVISLSSLLLTSCNKTSLSIEEIKREIDNITINYRDKFLSFPNFHSEYSIVESSVKFGYTRTEKCTSDITLDSETNDIFAHRIMNLDYTIDNKDYMVESWYHYISSENKGMIYTTTKGNGMDKLEQEIYDLSIENDNKQFSNSIHVFFLQQYYQTQKLISGVSAVLSKCSNDGDFNNQGYTAYKNKDDEFVIEVEKFTDKNNTVKEYCKRVVKDSLLRLIQGYVDTMGDNIKTYTYIYSNEFMDINTPQPL